MLRELPLDKSCTLRDLSFRSLHSVYATWRCRVPQAMPRMVHLSAELLASPRLRDNGEGLAAVVREIAEGANLRPRMSTAVDHAYALEPPPLLARRRGGRQHDRLLADWGIHHMHLSTKPHPRQPGFLGRTSDVLFGAFVGSNAYLIDLRPHESDGANWSELAILQTVVKNWPDAGIMQASNYVLGLKGGNWSDEDRRSLRQAGIAGGAVEIDGKVWSAGGGGQTLGGAPSAVANHCMMVSWFLTGYQPTKDELRAELTAMAQKHCVRNDGWHAHVEGEIYGFFTGGLFVHYGSLLP